MRGWTFRLRFALARGYEFAVGDLDTGQDVLEMSFPTGDGELTLLVPLHPREIQTATIVGTGHPDEASARAAGERVRDVLRVACVATSLAVDLGNDGVLSGVDGVLAETIEREGEIQLRPLVHGLDVFEQHASVRVFSALATATVGRPLDRVCSAFELASRSELASHPGLKLAADIYLSALFEMTSRACVLVLVSALEVVAEGEERPPAILALVRQFVQLVSDAQAVATHAERADYESLRGSLATLRSRSIGWTVRRLGREHTPESKTYYGLSGEAFASLAYLVRSQLTHGGVSEVDHEIDLFTAALKEFVRDVLMDLFAGGATS